VVDVKRGRARKGHGSERHGKQLVDDTSKHSYAPQAHGPMNNDFCTTPFAQ
jgi:hypothetical protein